MAAKSKPYLKEMKNLPIPLVLFTSYIAAEKSDELIKVFCQELPSILENINSCKKALEGRTKTVYKLKEGIKHDLKKLELANIILKELFKEEAGNKAEKEENLRILYSEISSCQNAKKLLKNYIAQFLQSRQVLDAIAVESSRYKNAQNLIQSYLTLQATNQKLIQDEYEFEYHVKGIEERNFEVQELLLKYKYDIMIHGKQLEKILREEYNLKFINHTLIRSLNEVYGAQREQYLGWIQIKKWASDTCQKIGYYKESTLSTKDFIKLLNEGNAITTSLMYMAKLILEIQEFIIFAKTTILKLESQS